MSKTDWPQTPTLHVADGEHDISNDGAFDTWSSRMSEQLRGRAERLGWKFRISDTALSRSDEFKFIFRARVEWDTDEGQFDYIVLLWSDYSGLSGSVSGPASEPSNDQRSRIPLSVGGTTVVFSDSANPDWIDASSKNANDQK